MPTAEPWALLWDAVKPLTDWPAGDEGRLIDIGIAWKDVGAAFQAAGAPAADGLDAVWVDNIGKYYKATIDRLRADARTAGEEMAWLGEYTVFYGNAVEWAKAQIVENIEFNEFPYQLMLLAPRGEADRFAQEMAGIINQLLDRLASEIASRGAGGRPQRKLPAIDSVPAGGLPGFPVWVSPTRNLPYRAAKGAAREQAVADAVGGIVIGEPGRRGMPIYDPANPRNELTDVDVIGPDGSFIAVGGADKAKDLADLGRKLQIIKDAADAQGVPAQAWFDRTDLPPSVIAEAERVLGTGNVHLFW